MSTALVGRQCCVYVSIPLGTDMKVVTETLTDRAGKWNTVAVPVPVPMGNCFPANVSKSGQH